MVTKPQAVIAVATQCIVFQAKFNNGYKTASGNRCCNNITSCDVMLYITVTKPQAVIAVATRYQFTVDKEYVFVTKPQAVIAVATKSET